MKSGLQTLQLSLLLLVAAALFSGCRGGAKVTIHFRPEIGAFIGSLANDEHDSALNVAMFEAKAEKKTGSNDFITLFGQAYRNKHPQARLASLFSNPSLPSLTPDAGDEAVLDALRNKARQALNSTMAVLRRRVAFAGGKNIRVTADAHRNLITVSADGIDDAGRFRQYLVTPGRLSFLETYLGDEVYNAILTSDSMLSAAMTGKTETVTGADSASLDAWMRKPGTSGLVQRLMHPTPSGGGYASPIVCYVYSRDTARLDSLLQSIQAKHILTDVQFLYGEGINIKSGNAGLMLSLYALRKPPARGAAPAIANNNILQARVDRSEEMDMPSIYIQLDTAGSHAFYELTAANQDKFIAMVFDNRVFMAPHVRDPISGGRITIDGHLELAEAITFTNIIRSGFLQMPVSVIE